MLKAVVHHGTIVPLEPLPPDWGDGTQVNIEPAETSGDLKIEADEWFRDMEKAVAKIDANDADIIDAAIREMDRQAKEQVRREMGLE